MKALPELFPGFTMRTVETSGAQIFMRLGGEGPPLLLLHGYPQTHAMWHRVAPKLAEHFSLVVPDLRGYGQSSVPDNDAENFAYSKRAMAADMVEVMAALGHDRFCIVGHDRGGRVGYRLALDHPDRVRRLVVLDIVPTHAMWHRLSPELAMKVFHWTFLAQPNGLPEWMIGSDPMRYLEHKLGAWNAADGLGVFDPRALEHYRAFFAMPERIRATCDDYRAGATYDLKADEADHAKGRKIRCPTLALWGAGGIPGTVGAPLDIWREWCTDVRGRAIDCGHFLVEEAPEATLKEMLPFLLAA